MPPSLQGLRFRPRWWAGLLALAAGAFLWIARSFRDEPNQPAAGAADARIARAA